MIKDEIHKRVLCRAIGKNQGAHNLQRHSFRNDPYKRIGANKWDSAL